MLRRLAGVLMLVLGAGLLAWVGYNLLVERLPETRGRSPIPAVFLSAGLLFVGYQWARGSSAE